jgi:PAS domain-containing protein
VTKDGALDRNARLLDSTRRMLDIAFAPQVDLERKLRRLTSVVVADFPRSLFKLQIVGSDGLLRVVPEFVTPLLQQIVDRYRGSLGPLDVRDVRLPTEADSLILKGLSSLDEIRLTDPADIGRYFAAHSDHAGRDELGRTVRDGLGIREVLLLPVRPDESPFGVVSVSTSTPLGGVENAYWRSVAAAITGIYRASKFRLLDTLKTLALASIDVPTILVDADGNPMEVNRAVTAILGFDEHRATIRHLGNMRPCLPGRSAFERGEYRQREERAFYIADAYGEEVACTVQTEPLTDVEGRTIGAVVRLRPTGDLEERSVRLTRRQREVARLVADGMSSKEIAVELGLSIHTVNYHRACIRDRLCEDGAHDDLKAQIRSYFLGNR